MKHARAHHRPSPWFDGPLVLTFAALLALLGLTVLLAHAAAGLPAAVAGLLIAGVKAALVGAVFMQLRASTTSQRIAALAGVIWLAILIGLTLTDFLTRFRG